MRTSTTRRRLKAAVALTVGSALMAVQSVASAGEQSARTVVNADSAGAVGGSYLVLFARDARPDVAERYGVRVVTTFDAALHGAVVEADREQALRMASDPSIRSVEQNTRVRRPSATRSTRSAPLSCGLDRIDQVALPLDGRYRVPVGAGAGVNVYVIDSGIDYTHPDLRPRARLGFDAFGGNGSDQNGNGTHLAGIIGGTRYGVAKKANLISVKVLDGDGGGTLAGVLAGIDWVTAHASGPSVANFVIGYTLSDVLDEAVRNSIAAGVTYVLSAGASTHDVSTTSPARVGEAITVGASDCGDRVASFSNYGAGLDLYAPGVDITSDWPGGGTSVQEGTNVSAAHGSGVAALYLNRHPRATPNEVANALTSAAVPGALAGVPTQETPNRLLQVARRSR